VITGELKGKVDRVRDALSGGISNPSRWVEQITCLLCIRRLDDLQTVASSSCCARYVLKILLIDFPLASSSTSLSR
jgi:HsdM N-terminal domain